MSTPTRPMRILLLNYEFPPLGGGAATASAQIARHMARRGVEVAVLTSHFKGLPRRERRDGYTIFRVSAMRRSLDRCSLPEMGGFILGAVVPAIRLAARFKPDLMHVFFGMPTGPVGYLVSRFTRIPYLLSLRGDDVPGQQSGPLALAHLVSWPITKRVWSRASRLVVNGEGLRERAARVLPGRHIDLIPNGVDADVFHPVQGKPSEGVVRLLYVGRLHEQKGLTYLLRGIAGLEPRLREKVRLELVGSGPEERPLRALATELGLDGQVRFAGWVSRDEIPTRYAQADIFVFPSFEEGMPNVVLEAMASGLAIVATDIPGNRDLVRDGMNGLLVPPTNVAALSIALQKLVTGGSLCAGMGRQSRELAGHYSWEYTAGRYLELSRRITATETIYSARLAAKGQ